MQEVSRSWTTENITWDFLIYEFLKREQQRMGICRNLNEFFSRKMFTLLLLCLSIFHLMLKWNRTRKSRLVGGDQWWMIKNFKMQTRVTDEIWKISHHLSRFRCIIEKNFCELNALHRRKQTKNVESFLWHSWTSLIMKLSTRQRLRAREEWVQHLISYFIGIPRHCQHTRRLVRRCWLCATQQTTSPTRLDLASFALFAAALCRKKSFHTNKKQSNYSE